jgi:hypothetical protein
MRDFSGLRALYYLQNLLPGDKETERNPLQFHMRSGYRKPAKNSEIKHLLGILYFDVFLVSSIISSFNIFSYLFLEVRFFYRFKFDII